MTDGSPTGSRSPNIPLLGAVIGGLALPVALVTGRAGPGLIVGLVALGLLLACVQRPEVGLALLVALTFAYAFDVGEKDLGVQSFRIPFVAIVLVAAFFSRRPAPRLPATEIPRALILIGAYAGFVLASTFWATDARPVIAGVVALGKVLLVVVAVIALVTDSRSLRLAVWSLLVAGGVLAAMSVHQHVTGNFGENYLGFAKAPVRNIVGDTEAPRVAGPIGDPNAYAQMMVVVVPLALERALHERRRRFQLAAGGVAILCATTTILTFSRGALLALVAVAALFLMRHRPRVQHVLVAGGLLILLARVVPDPYVDRALSVREVLPGSEAPATEGALVGRSTLMRIALEMWSDNPVLGVGQGNYVVRFAEYNRHYGHPPELGQSPHNLYLEIASETGLVGLALWLAIVVAAFRGLGVLRRRAHLPDDVSTGGLADGLGLALVAFLVNSLFLHGSYPAAFWLLVALSLAATQVGPSPQAVDEGPVPAPGLGAVAGG